MKLIGKQCNQARALVDELREHISKDMLFFSVKEFHLTINKKILVINFKK